jgi:signal transduction histidine kinase
MWLSLGRRDPQRMKPLLVCDLIGDIVRGLKQLAAGRGVRIDCQVAAVESEISADHVQISRALHNILVNAIEAVSVGSGVIRVCCVPNGPHVEISVEDNGCGMDPDQLGHAFEPYFTTKKFTGTGLGLFITRKVIEDHRGTIEMQSWPNKGTSVRIRLPLLNRPEVAIA